MLQAGMGSDLTKSYLINSIAPVFASQAREVEAALNVRVNQSERTLMEPFQTWSARAGPRRVVPTRAVRPPRRTVYCCPTNRRNERILSGVAYNDRTATSAAQRLRSTAFPLRQLRLAP